MKKIMFLILGVLLISIVSAADISFVFEDGVNVSLKIPVFDNDNSITESTTRCNITIRYPNESLMVENGAMGFNQGYYSYMLLGTLTTIYGVYPCALNCENGADYGFSTFTFMITPNGEEITIERNILYVGILIAMIALCFLFMFMGLKFIAGQNTYPIGLFFVLIAMLLTIYCVYLGYIYGNQVLTFSAIAGGQSTIFIVILYSLIFIMLLSLTYLLVQVIKEIKVRKSVQKYGTDFNQNTQQYEYK